jgi:hypothetical protein
MKSGIQIIGLQDLAQLDQFSAALPGNAEL